jgi:hypothetical protein
MCLLATEFKINILVTDFQVFFVTANLPRLKYITQIYAASSTGNTRMSIDCKLKLFFNCRQIKRL